MFKSGVFSYLLILKFWNLIFYIWLFYFSDNASQPETKAIIENLIQKQDFSLSVALDGGSVLVTYPYDKPVQTGM